MTAVTNEQKYRWQFCAIGVYEQKPAKQVLCAPKQNKKVKGKLIITSVKKDANLGWDAVCI